jgi:hypothetical protein
MADDFTGFDDWLTRVPIEREERMTFVICKRDHGRLTRTPAAPCPQCERMTENEKLAHDYHAVFAGRRAC